MRRVIEALVGEFAPKLAPAALGAAKAAAAIMAMNNIYYRFVHLVSAPDYKSMPAKLRMNVIGRPGVEKTDFELWSLAVSAINGCGMCVDAHERELRKAGVGDGGGTGCRADRRRGACGRGDARRRGGSVEAGTGGGLSPERRSARTFDEGMTR